MAARKPVAIEGALHASSVHGNIEVVGSAATVQLRFSSAKTLRAVLPPKPFQQASRFRGALGHVAQPIDIYVADELWLRIEKGKIRPKLSFKMGLFILNYLIRG